MGCCSSASSAAQSSKREWKPLEDRSCTDIPWLLLFILFCIGMGFICGFSVATGAAARLVSGYDSYGNICGQKNAKLEAIPNSGMDHTHRKYLHILTGDMKLDSQRVIWRIASSVLFDRFLKSTQILGFVLFVVANLPMSFFNLFVNNLRFIVAAKIVAFHILFLLDVALNIMERFQAVDMCQG